jgi:hypothetical protein
MVAIVTHLMRQSNPFNGSWNKSNFMNNPKYLPASLRHQDSSPVFIRRFLTLRFRQSEITEKPKCPDLNPAFKNMLNKVINWLRPFEP